MYNLIELIRGGFMREVAKVVKKNKNGEYRLEKKRNTACGSCPSKNNCYTSKTGDAIMEIEAKSKIDDLNAGDYVLIEIPNVSPTKISFLLYGIPLIIFISLLLILSSIGVSEGYAAIFSLIPMVGFYIGLNIFDRKNREKLKPVIVEKVEEFNVPKE
jgi:sigma-E factor negative regulatory protein RseC